MSQKIAFFDFDGTITTKDTLLEFIRFSKGKAAFYAAFALNSPWLVAYKLKLIPNQTAKEKVLSFLYKNMPLDDFLAKCNEFAATELPALIRPKAIPEIKTLQEKGFDVVIVSASPEPWIAPWAARIGANLLGTRLETREYKGRICLTGKIDGHNCYGEEKVRRIRAVYDLSGHTEIYAYGDTSGDKPMLALGTASFFKPFR